MRTRTFNFSFIYGYDMDGNDGRMHLLQVYKRRVVTLFHIAAATRYNPFTVVSLRYHLEQPSSCSDVYHHHSSAPTRAKRHRSHIRRVHSCAVTVVD